MIGTAPWARIWIVVSIVVEKGQGLGASEAQRESNFLIFDSKGQKFNQVKPQKNVR